MTHGPRQVVQDALTLAIVNFVITFLVIFVLTVIQACISQKNPQQLFHAVHFAQLCSEIANPFRVYVLGLFTGIEITAVS